MAGWRPLPPTYFMVSLILVIGLHFLLPIKQIVDWPYRWFGFVLGIIGSWLNLWADQLFKKYKTEVKPYQKSSVLVTEGPFRMSRHPMYLGMVLILLGLAIFLGSLITFLPLIAFTISMQMVFISIEEKMMLETFGDEYRQYSQKVRRWF